MRFKPAWVLAAVMMIAAGCKQKQNTNEIVVGEFASLTGATASFGQSSHEGLVLALEQINAQGGVLGKQIRVITEDDASDANQAVNVVQKLVNSNNVCAVIGEVASKRSLAGGGVCDQYHCPMLSPASTNPDVTVENGKVKPYVFRICFTDTFQGRIDGKFAAGQNWKKVAVMTNVDEDYSKGLSNSFKKAFAGSGEIVAEESYSGDTKDFKSQLSRIRDKSPDAVYVAGYYNEVGLILPQAKQVGLNVPFFGGDGWDSPQTVKLPEAQGDFYSDHFSPEDPGPEVQKFVKAYQAKYGKTPDAMAVLGYDSMRVIADAIKRAGKPDRQAITGALAQTKNFPGASGTITIDAEHNARKPIVILQIKNQTATLYKTYPPE
ncbi:MAG TPA: ABC transporter substrate-binding protein [Tepidisphaeraceae bacterium]|nr:ABC transporter substrate-binding protein [Tepidisphaeraceae bacterium]